MFSYAGIALSDPFNTGRPIGKDDDAKGECRRVADWIERNIRPEEIFPFAAHAWTGTLTNSPLLQITPERPRPIKVGSLWWPRGAMRFARAHYVVSESQLEQIRKNVQQPRGTLQNAILSLADGARTLNIPMSMVPAWPLAQAVAGAHMWMLTLVDDRYWWQPDVCEIAVQAGVTTWNDIYTQLGNELGITINADPIAAAYGMPPENYAAEYQPTTMVMDAVAWSVGQRIVRDAVTGTVSAQNATTAIASVTAQLATVYPPYAGGALRLLPNQ